MDHRCIWLLSLICLAVSPSQARQPSDPGPVTIRIATFNLRDVRTNELTDPTHPRLRQLAEVIQRVRPNVILLSEIACDAPGAPDVPLGAPAGGNGQRFADTFLAVAQATDVAPLRFRAFMAPTNSGLPSGMDLDRSGEVVQAFPTPPPRPGEPLSEAAVRFGNDCWGFGAFPGQIGMALLVDERLEILSDQVRTFRLLPWDYMPGACAPLAEDGTTPWHGPDVQGKVRLSSTSHWDVPVRLPGGAVVHFLCSHPTPPHPDGHEKRNARRNHDEIRFWADYLDGGSYIVDDNNIPGALDGQPPVVILGTLSADPDEGASFKDPIGTLLFTSRRIDASVIPVSDRAIPGLDPDDTAAAGLRVDYVLPGRGMEVKRSGVWREPPVLSADGSFPSDHFPVWMDLIVPAPAQPPGR
jgi:hypothetical protein